MAFSAFSLTQFASSQNDKKEIRKVIERNRLAEELARRNVPKKKADKKLLPFPAPAKTAKKSVSLPPAKMTGKTPLIVPPVIKTPPSPQITISAPPAIPGKVLLLAIDLLKVQRREHRVIDEDHLRDAYQGRGLEICYSEDRQTAYFFASEPIDFETLETNLHPLCRFDEILEARPQTEEAALLFTHHNERTVRYGDEILIFLKAD